MNTISLVSNGLAWCDWSELVSIKLIASKSSWLIHKPFRSGLFLLTLSISFVYCWDFQHYTKLKSKRFVCFPQLLLLPSVFSPHDIIYNSPLRAPVFHANHAVLGKAEKSLHSHEPIWVFPGQTHTHGAPRRRQPSSKKTHHSPGERGKQKQSQNNQWYCQRYTHVRVPRNPVGCGTIFIHHLDDT